MRSPPQVGMISTLLMSPYLGAWVDLTPRLRAATTLTVVQVKIFPFKWSVNRSLQGVTTALSSVSLGLGLHHLSSFSSTHLLLLLTVVLGTAALGGLAAGGITLLIQVTNIVNLLIQVPNTISPVQLFLQLASSERLVGCYLRGQPGQPCKGQLCISGS